MTGDTEVTVVPSLSEGLVLPAPVDPVGDARGELADQLVEEARATGVSLVGPGGLLADLTKRVLELGLEVEMSEHLGYDKHSSEGDHSGNSRNGTRAKTVLTEIGPVEIGVPRDRSGTFEPQTIRKRQRRLEGPTPRNTSSSSASSGASATPRCGTSGRTPGPSSCRPSTTASRSAGSSTPRTPSRASTHGCAGRPEPEGTSPTSRPR